jgi:hypothetical protein
MPSPAVEGTERDRQAFSTFRAAFIMMKISVIGATGPTGIHLSAPASLKV